MLYCVVRIALTVCVWAGYDRCTGKGAQEMEEIKCAVCGKVIGKQEGFIFSPRKQAPNGEWVYSRIELICKECFDVMGVEKWRQK